MKYSFPSTYGSDQRIMLVDASLIPAISGALWSLAESGKWQSDSDYMKAYNAIAEMLASMTPISQLIEATNRVYMAVRQLSAGEEFSATMSGAQPAMPVVPPQLPGEIDPGLLQMLRQLQGLQTEGLFGIGDKYASLRDVWAALQPSKQEEVNGWLDKLDLLGDASDVTGLWTAFRGTVEDTAIVAEGGGVLALLLVGIGTVAATAGVQAAQVAALVSKLDTLLGVLGGADDMTDGQTTIAGQLDASRVMLS